MKALLLGPQGAPFVGGTNRTREELMECDSFMFLLSTRGWAGQAHALQKAHLARLTLNHEAW